MNNDIKSMSRSDLEAAYIAALNKIQTLEEKSASDKIHADSTIKSLEEKISTLQEQLRAMRQDKYGPSSEKMHRIMDKAVNEPEEIVDHSDKLDLEEPELPSSGPVQTKNRHKGKGNRKGKKHKKILNDADIPTEHQYHNFDKDFFKNHPNAVQITSSIWEEIVEVPSYTKRIIHHLERARLKDVFTEDGKPEIIQADHAPSPLIERSLVSPSIISWIVFRKYVLALPLTRQASSYGMQGIPFSKQNLSNWCLQVWDNYLEGLYEEMKKDLQNSMYVHCDETTFPCLDSRLELGRKTCYVIQAATGRCEEKGIVLFMYSATRQADFVNKILGEGNGCRVLVSDGYAGYFDKGFINSICMDHVRREFVYALKAHEEFKTWNKLKNAAQPEEIKKYETFMAKHAGDSFGLLLRILEVFRRLYELEAQAKANGLNYGEIGEMRNKQSRSIIGELDQILVGFDLGQDLVNYGAAPEQDEEGKPAEIQKVAPQSKIGKAISYYCRFRKYMENFLSDGRIDISNILVESGMRPVAILRKNALFFDTESGAQSGMGYLSLLTSAKRNGLNPQKYLEYILTQLKDHEGACTTEFLRELLPYSKSLPESLKMEKEEKYNAVKEMEEELMQESQEEKSLRIKPDHSELA